MAILIHILAFIFSLIASDYLFSGDANTTVGIAIVFFIAYLIGSGRLKK